MVIKKIECAMIYCTVSRYEYMPQNSKLKLYKTVIIRSIMTQGAETWIMTIAETNTLSIGNEYIWTRKIKRALEIKKKQGDQDIFQGEDIVKFIKSWKYGHVAKLKSQRTPNRIKYNEREKTTRKTMYKTDIQG